MYKSVQKYEDPRVHLKMLAHDLNHVYADKLKTLNTQVLVRIELDLGEYMNFLISNEGIREIQSDMQLENQISLSYKDFLRLMENKDRIVRYLMEGRVKVKGDIKAILDLFRKL